PPTDSVKDKPRLGGSLSRLDVCDRGHGSPRPLPYRRAARSPSIIPGLHGSCRTAFGFANRDCHFTASHRRAMMGLSRLLMRPCGGPSMPERRLPWIDDLGIAVGLAWLALDAFAWAVRCFV